MTSVWCNVRVRVHPLRTHSCPSKSEPHPLPYPTLDGVRRCSTNHVFSRPRASVSPGCDPRRSDDRPGTEFRPQVVSNWDALIWSRAGPLCKFGPGTFLPTCQGREGQVVPRPLLFVETDLPRRILPLATKDRVRNPSLSSSKFRTAKTISVKLERF